MQTIAVSQITEPRPAAPPHGDLRVGDWLVEPDLDSVSRDGVSVHVRPKLMDVLVYLAQNAGRTVPHEELRAHVWPDQRFIAASVLPRCIAELRQVLGDHASSSTLIQTIPKRGYRLIATVRPGSSTEFSPLPAPPGAGAAAWLQRARLNAARLWRSFHFRVE